MPRQLDDSLPEQVEAGSQPLAERGLTLPAEWTARIDGLDVEQLPRHVGRYLEVLGQLPQVRVEGTGEGQDVVALVGQVRHHRRDAVRAARYAGTQLGDHEVVQGLTRSRSGAGHGQDVVAQPGEQHGHVVGQGHGPSLLLAGGAHLGTQALLPPLPRGALPRGPLVAERALGPRQLLLEGGAGRDGLVGAVAEVADQLLGRLQQVEDVAAAGDVRPGLGLTAAEGTAGIGDGGLRPQPLVAQLQQTHAPGVGIAMFLPTQQVAEGGSHVGADQHGPVGLVDLVVRPDAHRGQVLRGVVPARVCHRRADDVVDRAQGDRVVKQVAEQFDDAAQGTMAEQDQGQHQLVEPGPRDRQVEKDFLVGRRRREGLVKGALGLGRLLVDELATDLVLIGEGGDRFTRQRVKGQSLALQGQQGLRGCGGAAGLGRSRGHG